MDGVKIRKAVKKAAIDAEGAQPPAPKGNDAAPALDDGVTTLQHNDPRMHKR